MSEGSVVTFTHPRYGKGLYADGRKVTAQQLKMVLVMPFAEELARSRKAPLSATFLNNEFLNHASPSSVSEKLKVLIARGIIEDINPNGYRMELRLTTLGWQIHMAAMIAQEKGLL